MLSLSSRLRFVAVGISLFAPLHVLHGAVQVGSSTLIGEIDYSDTFTLNQFGGVVPDRVAGGLRSQPAYIVESTYNPVTGTGLQFTQARTDTASDPPRPNMSFAEDTTPAGIATTTSSPYPGTSGAGSNTGFTQNGTGIDYGIPYDLRDEFVVQFDAVQSRNRVDITAGARPGTIFQSNSVAVFFRGTDFAGNPTHENNVSLFTQIDGVNTDTPLRGQPGYENFSTGLSTDPTRDWHNYAVRFDDTNNDIEIYLDEVSIALVDLDTFAGGIYANFSNDAVSVGGAGERQWSDNFQVGAPVPEPTALATLALGVLGLLRRRR